MKNIAHKFEIDGPPVMMALKVLNYLYEEEKRDYRDSNYIELRKSIIENFMDFSTEVAFTQIDELYVRFIARLTGYLTTVRQLEENLCKIFKLWASCSNYKDAIISNLVKEKKEEVKNYFAWRDKVFAHLERKGNSEIQQEVRLQYGGYTKDIKEECLSLRPNYNLETFAQIDIVIQHKQLLQHYNNWEELFIEYFPQLQ